MTLDNARRSALVGFGALAVGAAETTDHPAWRRGALRIDGDGCAARLADATSGPCR